MKYIIEDFGFYKGFPINLYKFENQHGMSISVMNLGATITKVVLADGTSVVCGFDQLEDYFSEAYVANAPYFGCSVGRYCSQIKDAKFDLNGVTYHLAKNCGENNLHGGKVGFDKKIWTGEVIERENAIGVIFRLTSPDGDEGFPGEVRARACILLTEDNEIKICYKAETSKDTPLSMTNHSYFNLSGFKHTVENCTVDICTNLLQEIDESGAGTGKLLDVTNTPNDLRGGRIIQDVQQEIGDGMEHFYVFENPDHQLIQTAKITEPESGRVLEVYSTEPCMLFYTAKYMSDQLARNEHEKYGKFSAFACETHRLQNGVNIPDAPKSITQADEKFCAHTVFKFIL